MSKLISRKIPAAMALVAVTLAVVSVAAIATPTSAQAACKHTRASTKSLSKSQARRAMRCMINGARRHHGLRSLKSNGDLGDVAQKHTRRMRKKHCFSHECPGEASLLQRIRRSGYLHGAHTYSYAENIAYSGSRHSTPRKTFKAWMHSAGHRTNILSSRSRHVGIGISARRRSWWTADFGSRG